MKSVKIDDTDIDYIFTRLGEAIALKWEMNIHNFPNLVAMAKVLSIGGSVFQYQFILQPSDMIILRDFLIDLMVNSAEEF